MDLIMDPTEVILEPDLAICDSHHHLWDHLEAGRYLLPDFLADAQSGHRIESTIYVESQSFYSAHRSAALRCVGETEFAAGVAAMADSGLYGPIRVCAGIVGHANLTLGAPVGDVLEAHLAAGNGRFKGIRHLGAFHADPGINAGLSASSNLYDRPEFREGFARLGDYGLTFEAWQFHTQLQDLVRLARAFPKTFIILNHVGTPLAIGPYAGRQWEIFTTWARDIGDLAQCPNVWVKLGGLGMAYTGTPPGRTSQDLATAWKPYIETCIEAFGVQRAMFESNFPVDRSTCSYRVLWNAFKHIATGCSAEEKAALFKYNAMEFYRIDR